MTSFRALHQRGNPFIMPNAWDIGSAKMLVAAGAKAIATSSAAHAFTLGRPDMGTVTRDECLAHASGLIAALSVPVSGDFENGFGDDPDTCAQTVRLAGEVGLAGICIEDMALPQTTAYDFDLAVERIRAASDAARNVAGDFFLVARADGIMNNQYGQAETLKRVRAFEAAGADGIYVPQPASMDDLAEICAATTLPVNALAAGPFAKATREQFAAIGVARISTGGAIARIMQRTVYDAAKAMMEHGDFTPLANALPGNIVDGMLR